jgi:hypothetical protein
MYRSPSPSQKSECAGDRYKIMTDGQATMTVQNSDNGAAVLSLIPAERLVRQLGKKLVGGFRAEIGGGGKSAS